MKAMQIVKSAEGLTLQPAEAPQPTPGKGEVLIRVHAAGVTRPELGWYPTTHTKAGTERLHAIPGHEFSGVISQLGEGVTGFTVGQAVYGMNDWFAEGATAEFCLTQPTSIAPKPTTLTHTEAATLPIAVLTAWQGLFDHAKLQPGERVLVHGGAGSVGLFAVQLAHNRGAHVITTVSANNESLAKQLGADEVIDYKKTRFEDVTQPVDVVFDTVGGETRNRTWPLLKPNGRMITIASDASSSPDPRVKPSFFIVEPNQAQLIAIAKQLDAGTLKTFVNAAVPLADSPAAYANTIPQKLGYGKVVITVAD